MALTLKQDLEPNCKHEDLFLQVTKPTNVVNDLTAPQFMKQEDVDKVVAQFQPEPTDVWITTYSKAGTTWTQQIVKLIRNRGEGDDIKINHSVPWFEANGYFKVDLTTLPKPRAFKCHMPYGAMPCGRPDSSPCKYIYVARNPKDVAVSFFFHYQRYQVLPDANLEWDIFFSNFLAGNVMFGDFFDHILSWWAHKDDDNVFFLKYEDMKKDHPAAVARIAKFIGVDLSDELIAKVAAETTFDVMKNNNTANYSWSTLVTNPDTAISFMRKGEVGDWKNHFTPEQSAEMDKICRERLEGTGLVFDFGC